LRGPADRAETAGMARRIANLGDSTAVAGTGNWIPMQLDLALAETRVGMRDSAWTHALRAARLAHERLGFQIAALPDRRALQLARWAGRRPPRRASGWRR